MIDGRGNTTIPERCPYHADLAKDVRDTKEKIMSLSNMIATEVMFVKVKNGEEKMMPIGVAVGQIWEATQFPRDRVKLFKIMNRYEKTKYIIKRAILAVAAWIILMHIFKFQVQEVIKFIFKIS